MLLLQVYETTPDDFLRLVGSKDSTPVHGGDIAVVRMQGLPYRANEEDIVREGLCGLVRVCWRGDVNGEEWRCAGVKGEERRCNGDEWRCIGS